MPALIKLYFSQVNLMRKSLPQRTLRRRKLSTARLKMTRKWRRKRTLRRSKWRRTEKLNQPRLEEERIPSRLRHWRRRGVGRTIQDQNLHPRATIIVPRISSKKSQDRKTQVERKS